MEKVKLNNQIVSMRKYAKQAKVHVINKLVKEIKLLQNRKGNEIQIQKAKRKAERCLETVALVKKIKPDEVSKLALLKTKDWKNVLQKKNSSLHDRCIAMLANYGAVQKEVEAFYSANEELVLKISDYIAQWEEKSKLPKDSLKTNKMSFMKKSSEKILKADLKDESLAGNKNNKFKTGLKMKSDAGESDTVFEVSKNVKAENLDSNVDEMEKVAVMQKLNNSGKLVITKGTESSERDSMSGEIDNSDKESESIENDDEDAINNNSLNNDNNEVENSSDEESNTDKTCISISKSDSPLKIDKHIKNKSKAITLLNLNELEGLDEIPVNSSFINDECDEKESSEDETNETLQNKNTDPFFLGHSKEHFSPKEPDDSSKDSEVDMVIKDSAHSFKHKTQTVKRNFFQRKDGQLSPQKHFQKSSYNHKNVSKRFKWDTENSCHRDKFASRDCYNKFQGKNINKNRNDFKLKNKPFSTPDTYDKKQFRNLSKAHGNKDDSSLKSKVPYKKGNASENLHPSWEAKRKQKELLNTSFQGKKIVFDD